MSPATALQDWSLNRKSGDCEMDLCKLPVLGITQTKIRLGTGKGKGRMWWAHFSDYAI